MEILQCFLPVIAVAMVLCFFIFIGLLVDPKGTLSMMESIKNDWIEILKGGDNE